MARLVFFGNERLATGLSTTAPTLQALIKAGHEVMAVVSHDSDSKSRKKRSLEIAEVADAHNIPVLLPNKPAEIIEQLAAYKADAAVLVAYGRIIPQSVIDIFPQGIINIHPSLLPLHRGPTPIESVILEGASETGVSIMKLVREMDAGPVYGQSPLELTGQETKQQLADSLAEMGWQQVVELLPAIVAGTLPAVPQDDALATYDQLITKTDGTMDFNKPAVRLEREIRAYAGWPGSRTQIGDIDVTITQAHAAPGSNGTSGKIHITDESKELTISCKDGCLYIDKLKPAGKKEMTTREFLSGYGSLI